MGTPNNLPAYLSGMPSSVIAFMALQRFLSFQFPFLWAASISVGALIGLDSHAPSSPALMGNALVVRRRSAGPTACEWRLPHCLENAASVANKSMSLNSASSMHAKTCGAPPGGKTVNTADEGSPASPFAQPQCTSASPSLCQCRCPDDCLQRRGSRPSRPHECL